MNNELPIELTNLDIPGLDTFNKVEGENIFWCWQPETKNSEDVKVVEPEEEVLQVKTTSGRWVITNSITNPAGASIGCYNGDHYKLDEAIEEYKKELNEQQ